MGVNSRTFALSRSTCHMLEGCLRSVHDHLPRCSARAVNSVRTHVTRVFHRVISSPVQIVALSAIHRAVGHVKSPTSFNRHHNDTPRRRRPRPRPHGLFHSHASHSVTNVYNKLTRFFRTSAAILHLVALFLVLFNKLSV